MLWSDPDEKEGYEDSTRGAGYLFGPDVSSKFVYVNSLDKICRAHQMMQTGHKFSHEKNVCTVFSAPNYCYRCGNLASIVEVNEHLEMNFQQFESVNRTNEEKKTIIPDYFIQ